MLAEVTLGVSNGLSVAKQATSLPSSSTSHAAAISAAVKKEAEGGALAERRASDSDVVSLASDDTPNAEATQEASSNLFAASNGKANGNLTREALEKARQAEQQRLEKVTKEINDKLNENLSLRFEKDEGSGEDVVQLIEKKTGDVVRQFPPQAILDFREKFKDFAGLLFNQDA